jgi:hypothetical protein
MQNADTEIKTKSLFEKPDWAVSTWDLPNAQRRATRDVKPEDLVDANGLCAGMLPAEPPPSQEPHDLQEPRVISMTPQGFTAETQASLPPAQPGAAPLIQGGIALEMTECQVARRLGRADRVEMGANERNERAVTLTYLQGERPGIYRFVAGRLVSMERAPEPPPPPKPVRTAKPAKPAKPAKRTPPPPSAVQSAPLRPPTQITVGR